MMFVVDETGNTRTRRLETRSRPSGLEAATFGILKTLLFAKLLYYPIT